MMRLRWLVVAAVVCAVPAFSGPILINNTGVGGSVGGIDPNWLINGGSAYITTGSPSGFPFAFDGNPIWRANDSTSRWISPQATYGAGTAGDAPGAYSFTTTFLLGGLDDPTTAVITGRWLADNNGLNILINGIPTGQVTGANAWQTWSNFTISSGFVSGLNTIEFRVNNAAGAIGNPVGLRVEMSGTVEEIPEPATFVLMGAGLLGLGMLRRRRAS